MRGLQVSNTMENNLLEAWPYISNIACTVQLLNVNDLVEIREYYESKFKIPVITTGIVNNPLYMNIRHLPNRFKEKLINKYKDNDTGKFQYDEGVHQKWPRDWETPNLFVNNLKKKGNKNLLLKGFQYLDTLGKHRGIDWTKLWCDDLAPLREDYYK